jgi:hypothetical protein
VYHQPFPNVVTATPIESTVYNGFTNDVAQDLNAPRPISAGGTGATNAHDAMVALSGEIAEQLVTNYDSFPFVSGSFISTPGATSAPNNTSYFRGVACMTAGSDGVIEARDVSNSAAGYPTYVRGKVGGVWGAWTPQATTDANYVHKTGDTMTGNLTITGTNPGVILNRSAGAANNQLLGQVAGQTRWLVAPGNGDVETGGNTGSNFGLYSYADDGTFLGKPLGIRRDGTTTINGTVEVNGHIEGGIGYLTRNNGSSGPYGANVFNFSWNSPVMSGWIDSSNIGNVSDPRLKHMIEPLDEVLPTIKKLETCTFRYRDIGIYRDDGRRRPGLLSTNVHEVLPGAIEMGTPDEVTEEGHPFFNTLAVLPLITVLVKGIQELTARVEALEAR